MNNTEWIDYRRHNDSDVLWHMTVDGISVISIGQRGGVWRACWWRNDRSGASPWTPMPEAHTLEEAKATAQALWRMG